MQIMNYNEAISNFIISKSQALYTILNSVDKDSIEFLSWITAGVLAILALVTIIFTIYNEGVVQRANGLIREIKLKTTNPTAESINIIIQNINEVIFLLSNKNKYKKAMNFFIFILWLLGVIWALATIIYCVKYTSIVERTLVISAYVIMIITFVGLPRLFNSFNKTILDYDKILSIEYLEGLVELLQSHSNLDSSVILLNYVKPLFKFKKHSAGIQLDLQTLIPTSDYTVIIVLKTTNDDRITIKIKVDDHVDSLTTSKKLLIKHPDPNFNYQGLFEKLKLSNTNNPMSFIHILSNSENVHNCFSLSKEKSDTIITFKLQDKLIRSLTTTERDIISKNMNLLKLSSVSNEFIIEETNI
ncbi:hypothetical protein COE45_16395 [Bacillus thuringiensis]|uniref:hypothetical protein n=1 Tax=Bacillus thuringiensis TaxID=1428 RepID=UPI000BFC35BC|nr:hypothetical protein [Bacillus thuringiensis]PGX81364.1 hypothetical protein COE45_16395 [Bacillus thuringiensis]